MAGLYGPLPGHGVVLMPRFSLIPKSQIERAAKWVKRDHLPRETKVQRIVRRAGKATKRKPTLPTVTLRDC